MLARLNVVIVQSPRMSALQSEVTEQVMIELLGRPGIDLLIVQAIDSDTTSTDSMALTALESDVVVVDWHSEDTIVSRFVALGVDGYSASHELNPKASVTPLSSQRRLYCFDLRLGFRASQVSETILKLLSAKQIKTVSIGNLAPIQTSRLPVVATGTQASDPKPVMKSSTVGSAASFNRDSSRLSEITVTDLDEDQQLDRLVDGLNDADW